MAYPPARVVRCVKTTCVVFPILTLVFGMLFTSFLYLENPSQKVITPRRGSTEPLDIYLDRTNQCAGLLDRISDNISTAVLETCKQLRATEKKYFSLRPTKVNPFQHHFLITSNTICSNKTEVILLVHSLHDYHVRRQAIRDTWGNAIRKHTWPREYIPEEISLAFVLARHRNASWDTFIKHENALYNDIIQGDFFEHYHNMTLKSLLALKWVATYCPNVKYLIKSDDDMIINFPQLLRVLREINETSFIMGPYNLGSKVYRKGKWSISRDEYPFYYFPPYESGSAYVITSDLVKPLFEASEYVPPIFIDDVYITGILGKILNVNHIRRSGFAFWINKKPKPCDILKNRIVTGTKMKPEYMRSMWTSIEKGLAC